MRRWAAVAPAVLLAASGCLASKADIRLLQDEFRATRSQLGLVDTSIARTNEQRRQQIIQLSASIDRLNDSLRVLTSRLASFQAAVNGELGLLSEQGVRTQALLGQTTKNLQETRAQFEALRDQTASSAAIPPGTPPLPGAATPPAGVPGAATLFTAGREAFANNAFGTARSSFEQLLTSWPDADEAPRAQLYIGETYGGEGNLAAADSVYQLVSTKYPTSPAAATAMYRHGRFLIDNKRRDEALIVLNRLIREFPNSDEARLAKDLINRG